MLEHAEWVLSRPWFAPVLDFQNNFHCDPVPLLMTIARVLIEENDLFLDC